MSDEAAEALLLQAEAVLAQHPAIAEGRRYVEESLRLAGEAASADEVLPFLLSQAWISGYQVRAVMAAHELEMLLGKGEGRPRGVLSASRPWWRRWLPW